MLDNERKHRCLDYKAEYEQLKCEKAETDARLAEVQQKYVNRGCEIDVLTKKLEEADKCISVLQDDYSKLNQRYCEARDKNEALQEMHSRVKAQRDALIYAARVTVLGATE